MTGRNERVSVIQTLDAFESLGEEWNNLSAAFGSPLLDHAWFVSCARAFHQERDLRVVTLREGGVLVAAAPLALDRSRGRRLALIGTTVLYEPSGWLYASESALRKLADAVMHLGERLVLQRVPVGSALCKVFDRPTVVRALGISRPLSPSYVVNTKQGWGSQCATMSRNARRQLRTSWNAAERDVGRAHFTILRPALAEVDDALDVVVGLESAGWKGHQRSAVATRPDLHCFFREYGLRASARNELRVTVLRFGSVVAAVGLGVEVYNRMWQLKIAYDEELARYRPGQLLIHSSIQSACEHNLDAFEFLGVADHWKVRWKPQEHAYRLLAVYPLTSRGIVGAVADVAGFLSRRLNTARDSHHERLNARRLGRQRLPGELLRPIK